MKKIFITLFFILTLSFILSGCSNTENEIYKLNKIDSFESLATLKPFGKNNMLGVFNDDGFSGPIRSLKLFDEKLKEISDITDILTAELSLLKIFYGNDNYYVFYSKSGESTGDKYIYCYNSDNKLLSTVTLEEYPEPFDYVYNVYECNSEFIMIYPESIRFVSAEGVTTNSLTVKNSGLSCIMQDDTSCYLYTVNNNTETAYNQLPVLNKIDITTKTIVKTIAIENIYNISAMTAAPGDVLYIIDDYKIKTINGNTYEYIDTVCDVYKWIDETDSEYIYCELVMLDSDVYIYTKTANGQKINSTDIYKLEKLSGKEYKEYLKENENKSILKIKTYSVEAPLKRFAKEYEKNNNVEIVFDAFTENASAQIDSTAFNEKLNAEIISGTADWDILMLSFADYTNYIQNGIFSDLYETDGNLAENEDFFSSIIKACQTNEKLYIFPITVSPSVFIADSALYEKYLNSTLPENYRWEDILSLADKLPDDIKLFGKLKKSYNPAVLSVTIDMSSTLYTRIKDDIINNVDKNIIIDYTKAGLELEKSINNNEKYGAILPNVDYTGVFSVASYLMEDALNEFITEKNKTYIILPFPQNNSANGNRFYLQNGAAVMAKSENKQAALNFIKEFANNINRYYPMPVIAVSRSAFDKQIEYAAQTRSSDITVNSDHLKKITDYMGSLNYLMEGITTVSMEISEISTDYLYGNLTAQQAAEAIYNKYWLYLKE